MGRLVARRSQMVNRSGAHEAFELTESQRPDSRVLVLSHTPNRGSADSHRALAKDRHS